MAKRRTKEEYISLLKEIEKNNEMKFKVKLEDLDKITLATKLKSVHKVCNKTRDSKVSSYLEWPACQYCAKIKRNEDLVKRRRDVYKNLPMPTKGTYSEPRGKRSIEVPKGWVSKKDTSMGEQAVIDYLKSIKANFKREVPLFIHRKNMTPLRVDFVVTKVTGEKVAIEYDGEQHFRSISKYGGYRGYYRRLMLDETKDRVVKRYGMPLLRIPYWEYKNIPYLIDEALGR